jgi:hypothetical protein
MAETNMLIDPDVVRVGAPEFERARQQFELSRIDCGAIKIQDCDEAAH